MNEKFIINQTEITMNKHDKQVAQFGKYKGRLISWILENDKPYAEWLFKKSNSNTKSKRAAQSLIDKLLNPNRNLKQD